ncbi:MAG: hypothetical protein PVJ60_05690 [Phycisphaerales bacterium]|jgi:hypothetical protein
MRKLLITTNLLLYLTGAARVSITFDFDDSSFPGTDSAVVSAYMTSVYGYPATSSDGPE